MPCLLGLRLKRQLGGMVCKLWYRNDSPKTTLYTLLWAASKDIIFWPTIKTLNRAIDANGAYTAAEMEMFPKIYGQYIIFGKICALISRDWPSKHIMIAHVQDTVNSTALCLPTYKKFQLKDISLVNLVRLHLKFSTACLGRRHMFRLA